MRRFLSLFPISRREADHAADVIESMSWAELINGAILITIAMIMLPVAVLMLSAPDGWA